MEEGKEDGLGFGFNQGSGVSFCLDRNIGSLIVREHHFERSRLSGGYKRWYNTEWGE